VPSSRNPEMSSLAYNPPKTDATGEKLSTEQGAENSTSRCSSPEPPQWNDSDSDSDADLEGQGGSIGGTPGEFGKTHLRPRASTRGSLSSQEVLNILDKAWEVSQGQRSRYIDFEKALRKVLPDHSTGRSSNSVGNRRLSVAAWR
jgi:transcription elongation factor